MYMTETKRKIGRSIDGKNYQAIARLESWLTRDQVASMLNISMATVRNLELAGKLTPSRAPRSRNGQVHEVYVYDPDEVARVPGRHRGPAYREPGAVWAQVYALLDAGRSIREIVLEISETSDKIREIKERWLDDGGSDRVIAPTAWEDLERALGAPFGSVTELVELVAALAKRAGAAGASAA